MNMIDTDLALSEFRALLGDRYVLSGPDAEGYLEDFWGRARGKALCVVQPANTADVSAIVSICQKYRISIFPQGGNTGTVWGAVPDATGRSIVLSLRRMNKILDVDPVDGSITAEAGCILADIQHAAENVDRLFPLSLGAEGSCQIGGNISTNAGGTNMLRYGNARDLVLGLEVVLPDGRIWNGLRALRKNNTGYDLKHLFIGAEGSLGIVTAVTLKLFPSLPEHTAVLIAFSDIASLPEISAPLASTFGPAIVAMELISASEVRIIKQIVPDVTFPFGNEDGWFLLVDIATKENVSDALEPALSKALEEGHVDDVIVTLNESQRAAIWRLRHSVTEAHKKYGMGMSHDISVSLAKVPHFLQTADEIVARDFPGAEVAVVAHVGDGNLHYNVIYEQSRWDAIEDKDGTKKRVYKAIYDLAAELNGSFSAEHGIGALHVPEMKIYKSALELEMMRGIKTMFDPNNIMNPGRVLPA